MKNSSDSKQNFSEFHQAQRAKVLSRCIKSTGNRPDAEDVSQDIWFRIYLVWPFIDDPEKYLARTTTNALTDFHRRKISRSKKFSTLEGAHEWVGDSHSVEGQVIYKLTLENFDSMFSEDEHVVLNMLAQGYNMVQISDKLGVSYGWVRDKVVKIGKKFVAQVKNLS